MRKAFVNKVNNFCKDCEAWCCYDGVYLSPEDEERIKTAVASDVKFFSFLPQDYIVESCWENKIAGRKTNVKDKKYQSKNFPKHFNQTCCVFLKDNKCMLEEFAIQKNEDRWEYKPKTCCIFPLQEHDDQYVLPASVQDDCNLGEKYPGFVSCLPCYKLQKAKFQTEFDYINNKKRETK